MKRRHRPTERIVVRWLASMLAVAGATASIVGGPTSRVAVHGDHPIDRSLPERPHVEPYLAVNPVSPDHLVAGAIVASPDREGPWSCAAFTSFDGGQRWSRHDFPMVRCIDPWILFAGDGAVLFTGIELRDDAQRENKFRLVLYRSEDGGRSWPAEAIDLGRAHDHELLAADRSKATELSESTPIYLVSRRTRRTPQGQPRHAIGLLRSTDGGRSFRPRSELRPSNLAQNPTGLVVLSDGTLVVSFYDFQRNVDGFGERGMLARPRAWAVRSTDGGAGFSEPMFVSEDCGAGDGFPGYPFLAADASAGRFADRLYHLCVRPGFDGLSLSTSDDAGETWTDPLRIDGAAGESVDVRTPMIAVDGEGRVAVAWYARRQIEGRTCQETFVAASVDGGASFLEALRVADEPSCPDTPGNGRVAQSWVMGGDYSSLAAGPDGRFHLLWADSRSGVFQIHHTALTIESTGTEDSSPPSVGRPGTGPDYGSLSANVAK